MSEQAPAGADEAAVLSIRNLTAGYGKLTILRDVSLAVAPRRFEAILGPNGSGKSTLLKSIYGLTQITDGAIIFAGDELTGTPPSRSAGAASPTYPSAAMSPLP